MAQKRHNKQVKGESDSLTPSGENVGFKWFYKLGMSLLVGGWCGLIGFISSEDTALKMFIAGFFGYLVYKTLCEIRDKRCCKNGIS